MKDLFILLVHLLITVSKLLGPGGKKTVIAGGGASIVCCSLQRKEPPRHPSSDQDPLFEYHRWQANLRILEIEPIKSVPYTPISHPFVERLIGTVRRELLDQTLFWNASDLEKKLEAFRIFYNHSRVHAALEGHTPAQFSS
ncbi:MAG: transposase, partial [Thiogranum sp.]